MMSLAKKVACRIGREIKRLVTDPPEGADAVPLMAAFAVIATILLAVLVVVVIATIIA